MQELTDALRESALEDHPGFLLHIGIVGNEENANRVRDYLGEKKIVWALAGGWREGWEQLTLSALAADCQRGDAARFVWSASVADCLGRDSHYSPPIPTTDL